MNRTRSRHALVGLSLFSLVLTACGTRVHGEIVALHSGADGAAIAGSGGYGATPGSGPGPAVSGGDVSGAGSSSGSGGSGGLPGSQSGSAISRGSGISVNSGPTGSGSSASAGGAVSGPGPSGAANKSPVVVGEVGSWSGVVGAADAPARDVFGAWASYVNAHGGILGHPIQVLVADDNDDAATDLSEVKSMVESRHVIALVNEFDFTQNDPTIASYLQSKGVPAIGGIASAAVWYQSPILFPDVVAQPALAADWAAPMAQAGDKKVGAAYCVEIASCKTLEQAWAQAAQKAGMQVVYQGAVSITQPDFTAQCLQAQGAGAQGILVVADGASVGRFATDCARQGYHPLIVNPNPTASATTPNQVAPIQAFPWMLRSGSPALTEYGQAVAAYDHNPLGSLATIGWVSGKLLQAALEISLAKSSTPSSAGLMQALWTMKDQTLGGLSPPLSFHQGAPATLVTCTYEIKPSGGGWVAPYGARPTLCAGS